MLPETTFLEETDLITTEEDTYLRKVKISDMVEFLSYTVPLFDAPTVYCGPDLIGDRPLENKENLFFTAKTIFENSQKLKLKMYLLGDTFDEVILEDQGNAVKVTYVFTDTSEIVDEGNRDPLNKKLISPFGIIPGTENFTKLGLL
jgi:hypothetical protein